MLFYSSRFDALVERLAQRVSARFPPVVANDPERVVPQERLDEILRETFATALHAEGTSEMGFIGRATLRNAFRRELREMGYDEKFVDFASEKFVDQFTRGSR
jgi:hypothetical protein